MPGMSVSPLCHSRSTQKRIHRYKASHGYLQELSPPWSWKCYERCSCSTMLSESRKIFWNPRCSLCKRKRYHGTLSSWSRTNINSSICRAWSAAIYPVYEWGLVCIKNKTRYGRGGSKRNQWNSFTLSWNHAPSANLIRIIFWTSWKWTQTKIISLNGYHFYAVLPLLMQHTSRCMLINYKNNNNLDEQASVISHHLFLALKYWHILQHGFFESPSLLLPCLFTQYSLFYQFLYSGEIKHSFL